jgi:hypothetical protein
LWSRYKKRILARSQLEQSCDFNYWIDEQFEGRAKKVIQDLVSMGHNLFKLDQQEIICMPIGRKLRTRSVPVVDG